MDWCGDRCVEFTMCDKHRNILIKISLGFYISSLNWFCIRRHSNFNASKTYSNVKKLFFSHFPLYKIFFKADPIFLHLNLTLKGIQYCTNTKKIAVSKQKSCLKLCLLYQSFLLYIVICVWAHIVIWNETVIEFYP